LDANDGVAGMTGIDDTMWLSLCNISLNPNKSDILTRWKYECKNGFWTREIISQTKVTVEVFPLKGKSYDRDVCY
jgi:hypothetical protein